MPTATFANEPKIGKQSIRDTVFVEGRDDLSETPAGRRQYSGFGQASPDTSWDWAHLAQQRGQLGAEAATMLKWDFDRKEQG